MIKAVKTQRKTFIETCEDGGRACDGFMSRLEQWSPMPRGTDGRLETWLAQGQDLQKHLQGTQTSKA